MNLIVNGENRSFNDNATIEQIIKKLMIKDKVMACAINMEIVKKENWGNFVPKENDKVELLQFVGGG